MKITPVKLDPQNLKVQFNTGVPTTFIQPRIVLVCGEVEEDLLAAMEQAFPDSVIERYSCRGYIFFKCPNVTIILTGIGSSNLEPLLTELCRAKHLGVQVVRAIINVGTAGVLGKTQGDKFGKIFVVETSYNVDAVLPSEADLLHPRWAAQLPEGIPTAETATTSRYYSCTDRPSSEDIRLELASNPQLVARIARFFRDGRLIEMETFGFYYYLRLSNVAYLSLRGVANPQDGFDLQVEGAPSILAQGLDLALLLLNQIA